jgi:hypothetical protein
MDIAVKTRSVRPIAKGLGWEGGREGRKDMREEERK